VPNVDDPNRAVPRRKVLAFAACIDPATDQLELQCVSPDARAMVEREDPALRDALDHALRFVAGRPVFDDDTDPRPAPEGAARFSAVRGAFAERLREAMPGCRVWCGALRR
jgi:hypothetical protein